MKSIVAFLAILVWLSGAGRGDAERAQRRGPLHRYSYASMIMKHGVSGKPKPVSRKARGPSPGDGVTIDPEQGKTITLTLTKASTQTIEKWIRTAGSVDPATKRVNGRVYGKDAELVRNGQKTRIFPLVGRDPLLQGRVVRVTADKGGVMVETDVKDKWYANVKYYIMEIIVDFGRSLAIPNEAIIEEAGRKVVYVSEKNDWYAPRDIIVGHRGELYTQILDGLKAGEQVVTFGSFFIDAEYKLRSKGKRAKEPGSNGRKGGQYAPHHH
ncbi:hypothetical protein MNBD_NITROSPINAE03-18 [hydrothermal vent metagenome]|uniref:CzcB-like C-terminal circularly permuted SH3-like domain-containing protein n=1 Tax=hydrothermal vent metagenome TaxID=652676 RepID=A0A3B1C308_9ZZZZ